MGLRIAVHDQERRAAATGHDVDDGARGGDFHLAEAREKFGGDAGRVGGLVALLAAGLSEGLPAHGGWRHDCGRSPGERRQRFRDEDTPIRARGEKCR
jgi:hypothetical protein